MVSAIPAPWIRAVTRSEKYRNNNSSDSRKTLRKRHWVPTGRESDESETEEDDGLLPCASVQLVIYVCENARRKLFLQRDFSPAVYILEGWMSREREVAGARGLLLPLLFAHSLSFSDSRRERCVRQIVSGSRRAAARAERASNLWRRSTPRVQDHQHIPKSLLTYLFFIPKKEPWRHKWKKYLFRNSGVPNLS